MLDTPIDPVERTRTATHGHNVGDDARSPTTEHIVARNREWLRMELPLLCSLADKVFDKHGEACPELGEIAILLAALRSGIERHMLKEEAVLFPLIRRMEEGCESGLKTPSQLERILAIFEAEHSDTLDVMDRIQTITRGFRNPDGPCRECAALLTGLDTLDKDLCEHILEESMFVFPRARVLSTNLSGTT